jgi:hypothetical protein
MPVLIHDQKRKKLDRRMEVDAAMRLRAVQVQRDREDGQLGDDEQVDDPCTPGRLREATRSEGNQCFRT